MLKLLYLWGAFHLGNAIYGAMQGRIGFIAPQKAHNQIVPSITWIERDEAAPLFWIVVAGNALFGAFLVWFAWNSGPR
jgi:hypothetical protein